MRVLLLGTAAGGGLPQWNCACPLCTAARSGRPEVPPRRQDCVAVSADGSSWYLLNASPDIRAQLADAPALAPGPGRRQTPVRGVLLTDAELDHALGVMLLREAGTLDVFATGTVLGALRQEFPMREVLSGYAGLTWSALDPARPCTVDGGLEVTPIPVSGKRPRYAATASTGDWVVAYRVTDPATGGVLLYAPCLADWPPGFDDLLAGADVALLDGTFWHADEMGRMTGKPADPGAGVTTPMGHLPITGPGGTLPRLAAHPTVRRIYTHLNNTNPLLDATSPERAELDSTGIEVLPDNTALKL